MTRYTLHIPEVLNNGAPVGEHDFGEIEVQLLDIAGGFTIVPGVGGWRGDSQTYREPVRLYLIDTNDAPQILRALQALAERVADVFEQESVYLTRQEIETFLVSPARKEIEA